MDVYFSHEKQENQDLEKKSIFVKVPLTGEASKNFKQVIFVSYSLIK